MPKQLRPRKIYQLLKLEESSSTSSPYAQVQDGFGGKRKNHRPTKSLPYSDNEHEQLSPSEQQTQFASGSSSSSSGAQHAADGEQNRQRCAKWQERRPHFDRVFSDTRAPARAQCCTCGDREGDSVLCLDCGPGVVRCIDCTMSYHKECHLLHKPELMLETSVRPFPLRSRFVRHNHQCATPHTKTIQIFDEKGRIHDCWFTSCACESESATLLRWELWAATPDRPRLAFHDELLRWFESLVEDGRLSLKTACEVVSRRNSLDVDEASALFWNLTNGCFEEYRHFRLRCDNPGSGNTTPANGSIYEASPKSSVNGLESESHVPYSEPMEESDGATEVKGHEACSGRTTEDGATEGTSAGVFPTPVSLEGRPETKPHVVFPGSNHGSYDAEVESGTSAEDPACRDWSGETYHSADRDNDSETEYIYVSTDKASASGCADGDVKPILIPVLGEDNPGQANQAVGFLAMSGAPPATDHPSDPRMGEIVVMSTSNEGKIRRWDKKQYCLFCRASYAKLPRHLESIHRGEPDIVLLASVTCLDTRRHMLSKLRNLGNHMQNCDVLRRGEGMFIVAKRPNELEARTAADYAPCPHCFGYYVASDLWNHNCPLKNAKPYSSSVWLNLTLQH